jgi:hypothetical protein
MIFAEQCATSSGMTWQSILTVLAAMVVAACAALGGAMAGRWLRNRRHPLEPSERSSRAAEVYGDDVFGRD